VPLGVFGKATVKVDALAHEVLAEQGLAPDAKVTGLAGRVGVAHDAVANLDILDVFANAHDLSYGFVTGAEREPARDFSFRVKGIFLDGLGDEFAWCRASVWWA
jgi:hypothetical protein